MPFVVFDVETRIDKALLKANQISWEQGHAETTH